MADIVEVIYGILDLKHITIEEFEKINQLKVRNEKLLKELEKKKVKGKDVDELKLTMDKEYVDKFWIGCRS